MRDGTRVTPAEEGLHFGAHSREREEDEGSLPMIGRLAALN